MVVGATDLCEDSEHVEGVRCVCVCVECRHGIMAVELLVPTTGRPDRPDRPAGHTHDACHQLHRWPV